MTVWRTPPAYKRNRLPYIYLRFGPNDQVTIDLDNGLLQELVELFVSIQLDYWQEINRLASFKFPDREVPPYINQVEQFLEEDEDGFVRLFGEYIPYFIFLKHVHRPHRPCTQKRPHLKPRDHYCDHIAAWRRSDESYRLVLTEVKTTKDNARVLVRTSVFNEFRDIEDGKRDRDIKAEINALDWYFIRSREDVKELVDSLFWKGSIFYQACVVSTKVSPGVFNGFENVVAKNPDTRSRRLATVVPIDDWEAWVSKIRSIARQYIARVKDEGHF
jgi:hypothetical protein